MQINAQIFVEKFDILNELDAQIDPVYDNEGIPCALIKVNTTDKRFEFELGLLPPPNKVDKSRVGEIWVYVPEGTRKMKIVHPDLGSLKGYGVENGYYEFPQRIKRTKCYRMELTHKEVVKVVGPQTPATLTFKCNVEGAEVILGEGENAKSYGRISNHQFSMTSPKEQSVIYKIKKERYEDFNGIYKVENEENIVEIQLKPLFGRVSIKTLPNAVIKLNGHEVGRGSFLDFLDLGYYTVESSLYGYYDEIQTFTLSSGENKDIVLNPKLIYGSINVASNPSGADIYIDGSYKGKTPMLVESLIPGNHKLELRKNGFVNINKTITIVGDETEAINAAFTTSRSIQTLREHSQNNHFYINAGFIVGSFKAVNFGFGYSFSKLSGFLIEVGGFYGLSKSDDIYWYNSEYDNIGNASYSPYGFYGALGYAIKGGLRFYVTPKVGVRYVGLKSNWTGIKNNSDPAKGSYAMSAILGCSFSYTICPNLVLTITPEYGLSIKESNGFKEISTYSLQTKELNGGVNGIVGLIFYF